VVTGLGSILGTGAFVAIGLAAGFAGSAVLPALVLAGAVAAFNGLSSAQLAAHHPVSGGTYEYGYRLLGPLPGFLAGWLFLVAKTASAAAGALGIASFLGLHGAARLIGAVGVVAALTLLVASGIRHTTRVTAVIVSVAVAGLLVVVVHAAGSEGSRAVAEPSSLWEAAAFLFVAFTGYGRIATLGEEVRTPQRTIPLAVILSLTATTVLYLGVAWAVLRLGGPELGPDAPPDLLARMVDPPWDLLVRLGALVAMVGVVLNLVLGLSRVWLAMGRRGDMPRVLARVHGERTPLPAVLLTGVSIASVALVGRIRPAWEFSALTVLIYYGLTNLAAIRLPEPRFPRWIPTAGLVGCIGLVVSLRSGVWPLAATIVGLGVAWRMVFRRSSSLAPR
jgi:APA family basic amino acid/polyamine antiporter